MEQGHSDENIGLRGIQVASTKIARIDGIAGTLYYRGYRIEELARDSNFEEVAFLLIHGRMPSAGEFAAFSRELADERPLPGDLLSFLGTMPAKTPTISVLQSVIAALAGFCPNLEDQTAGANRRRSVRILAKIPVIVAAWERIKNGKKPVSPDKELSHAANFLYMLNDEKPAPDIARALDVAFILHAEHGFNASTFTARVVASTQANLYASISAATGSLSGPLHGGANELVMKNLIEIGSPDRAAKWVKDQFDSGRRIMGMGHAVYRTVDPRARILEEMAKTLAGDSPGAKWWHITNKMVMATQEEFRTRKGKEIYPNVDLFSGTVYSMLGLAPDLFVPVFAIARTAGWEAHILEEQFPELPVKPVIYRPESHYEGTYCGEEGCRYIPLNER